MLDVLFYYERILRKLFEGQTYKHASGIISQEKCLTTYFL